MSVRFCDQCGSRVAKTTVTGAVTFKCVCGQPIEATAEDTLMYEEHFESAGAFNETFIENSPFDPAANVVKMDCPCGLDFLTKIYVGDDQTVLYTCTCGFRATHNELTKK